MKTTGTDLLEKPRLVSLVRRTLIGAAIAGSALVPAAFGEVTEVNFRDVIVAGAGANPIERQDLGGSFAIMNATDGTLLDFKDDYTYYSKSVATITFYAISESDCFTHPGSAKNPAVVFTATSRGSFAFDVDAWSQTAGWSDGLKISVKDRNGTEVGGPIATAQTGHRYLSMDPVALDVGDTLTLYFDRQANYMSDGTRMVITFSAELVPPVAVASAYRYPDGFVAGLAFADAVSGGERVKVWYGASDGGDDAAGWDGVIDCGTPGAGTVSSLIAPVLPDGARMVRIAVYDGETVLMKAKALDLDSLDEIARPQSGELVYDIRTCGATTKSVLASVLVTPEAGTNTVRVTGYCTDGGAVTNAVQTEGVFAAFSRAEVRFDALKGGRSYAVWFTGESLPDGAVWRTAATNYVHVDPVEYIGVTRSVNVDGVVRNASGEIETMSVSFSGGVSCESDDLYLLYGATDGGSAFSGWDNVVKLDTVAGNVTEAELTGFPTGWGTSYRYLRIALKTHAIPASAYEQTNLLAMWDGIENGGEGVHDAEASQWKDLKGGYHASALGSSQNWSDSGAVITRNVAGSVFRCTSASGLASAMGANYTVEAVVTPNAAWKNNYGGIMGNHGNGMKCICLGQYNSADSGASFHIGNNGTTGLGHIVLSQGDMHIGSMTTFTVSEDEAAMTLYIDSGLYQSAANGNGSSTALSFSTWFLGRGFDSGGREFDGTIHCGRVYSGVLSEAQLARNRQLDEVRFGTREDAIGYSCSEVYEWVDMTVPIAHTESIAADDDLTITVNYVIDNVGDGASAADVYAVYRSAVDLAWTTNVIASAVTASGSARIPEQLRPDIGYEIAVFISNDVGRVSALSAVKNAVVPSLEDFPMNIVRDVHVTATNRTGAAISSVEVTVGPGPRAAGLYAVYGDAYHGISTNRWTHIVKVAEVPSEGGVYEYAMPQDWGDGSRYLKFFTDVEVTPTSASYPAADMIAQWDAIDNVGRGLHDASAKVWTNLAENAAGEYHLECRRAGTSKDAAVVPEWTDSGWVSYHGAAGSCGFPMDETPTTAFYAELGTSWSFDILFTPSLGWFSNYSGIVGLQDHGRGVGFGQHVTDYFEWVIGNRAFTLPASSFTIGRTYHVVGTASPTATRLYLDGELVASGGANSALSCTSYLNRFAIGACWSNVNGYSLDAGRTFGGTLHSVRAYRKALTPEEVKCIRRVDQARFAGATLTNFMASSSELIVAEMPLRPMLASVEVSGLGSGDVAVISGRLSSAGATNGVEVTVSWGTVEEAPDHCRVIVVNGAEFAIEIDELPDDDKTMTYYSVRAEANGMFDETSGYKTIVDDAVYVWQAVEGEWSGSWNDPAHWSSTASTCFGAPIRATATAEFSQLEVGKTITVTLDAENPVKIAAVTATKNVSFAVRAPRSCFARTGDRSYKLLVWDDGIVTNRFSLVPFPSKAKARRSRLYFTDANGDEIAPGGSACGLWLSIDSTPGALLRLQ